jgi:hypothetical protein
VVLLGFATVLAETSSSRSAGGALMEVGSGRSGLDLALEVRILLVGRACGLDAAHSHRQRNPSRRMRPQRKAQPEIEIR